MVDNDENLKQALRDSEARILDKVEERVGILVHDHLKNLRFDTQLSAGLRSTIDKSNNRMRPLLPSPARPSKHRIGAHCPMRKERKRGIGRPGGP